MATMPNYTIKRNAASCNVAVSGEFEVSIITELQAALRKELERETREVLFDFETTTFLDSSGIGLLIAASNSMAKIGGTVRLINVPADIMKTLQSMRLAPRLNAVAR